MIDHEEYKLLVDISVLYYLEGKTQNEIAKEFYISRPKVSRMLKKAREIGIVDINIKYQTNDLEDLKSKIKRKYNLEKVVLVKTLSSSDDTLTEVGKVAAKELGNEVKAGMTLGISWGKTVRTTASSLQKQAVKDLKVVELFGAFSFDLEHTDMLGIGRNISSKLGGKLYPLPSPIYIEDEKAREAIVSTPVIRDALVMIENCDLIITGIGAVETESHELIWCNHVSVESKENILENGGVGFLCAHFFDGNGRFLDNALNESVIGIKTKSIRDKRSFVVASGTYKSKAILAALKGGLVNILVSDVETLEKVLELDSQ